MLRKQPAIPAKMPEMIREKNLILSGSMPAALAASTFSPVALILRPMVALLSTRWMATTASKENQIAIFCPDMTFPNQGSLSMKGMVMKGRVLLASEEETPLSPVREKRTNTVPPVEKRLRATPQSTALASSLRAKRPKIKAMRTEAAMPANSPIQAFPVAAR